MRLFIYFIVFIGLISCKNKPKKQEFAYGDCAEIKVRIKDFAQDVKLSDVWDIDSLLVLECRNDSRIGVIRKTLITDNRIYILDNSIANCIICFDRKGHYINVFKKIGDGPNEYKELMDMTCVGNVVYVTARDKRMFKLDSNLHLIESINIKWTKDIPYTGHCINAISIDTLIFSSDETQFKYNVYSLNREEFIAQYSPSRGLGDEMIYPYLTKASEGIFYTNSKYSDTIYTVKKDDVRPYCIVKFSDPLSNKQREERIKSDFRFLVPGMPGKPDKMFSINQFIETTNFTTFSFLYKKRRHYLYKNKAQTIIIPNNVENDLYGSRFIGNPIGRIENSIVVSADPVDMIFNKKKIVIQIPKELSENSNPVLIFFHPKFDQ